MGGRAGKAGLHAFLEPEDGEWTLQVSKETKALRNRDGDGEGRRATTRPMPSWLHAILPPGDSSASKRLDCVLPTPPEDPSAFPSIVHALRLIESLVLPQDSHCLFPPVSHTPHFRDFQSSANPHLALFPQTYQGSVENKKLSFVSDGLYKKL